VLVVHLGMKPLEPAQVVEAADVRSDQPRMVA
jgi:hypothetical protein